MLKNNDIPNRILVFNSKKVLVGIYHSITTASQSLGISKFAIYSVCHDKQYKYHDKFFRLLYEDRVELDLLNDLGGLKLEEYDALAGIERHSTPKPKSKPKKRKHIKIQRKSKTNKDEDTTIIKRSLCSQESE